MTQEFETKKSTHQLFQEFQSLNNLSSGPFTMMRNYRELREQKLQRVLKRKACKQIKKSEIKHYVVSTDKKQSSNSKIMCIANERMNSNKMLIDSIRDKQNVQQTQIQQNTVFIMVQNGVEFAAQNMKLGRQQTQIVTVLPQSFHQMPQYHVSPTNDLYKHPQEQEGNSPIFVKGLLTTPQGKAKIQSDRNEEDNFAL